MPDFILDGKLDEFRLRQAIDFVIDHKVIMDSSPGIPFMRQAPDNKRLFERHRALVVEAVVERMGTLSERDYRNLRPADLVRRGVCDPVKIFIKNEPHSLRKIAAKQYRLISSVSVIDQVCERLLYGPQNEAEIALWRECPSKPGIGLDDKGLADVWKYIKPRLHEAAETDIRHWDWSVQWWELEWEVQARYVLAQGRDPLYLRMMLNRVWAEANCVFCLSDGRMFSQMRPGKRCSGSYNTSSGNSRMRWALARLIGCEWAITMGDDCVEQFVEGAQAEYLRRGHPSKMYKRCETDSFEFCSMQYVEGKAFPLNWGKMFYRLMNKSRLTELDFVQFRQELRHSPWLAPCEQLLKSLIRWGGDKDAQSESEEGAQIIQDCDHGCDEGGR